MLYQPKVFKSDAAETGESERDHNYDERISGH